MEVGDTNTCVHNFGGHGSESQPRQDELHPVETGFGRVLFGMFFFNFEEFKYFSLQKPGMNEASFIQASMAVGKGHYT